MEIHQITSSLLRQRSSLGLPDEYWFDGDATLHVFNRLKIIFGGIEFDQLIGREFSGLVPLDQIRNILNTSAEISMLCSQCHV